MTCSICPPPGDPTESETTLAVIGDVHGSLATLRQVVAFLSGHELSGVLLVGDFVSPAYERRAWGQGHDRGRAADEVAAALAIVEPLGVECLWVPGNHDPRGIDLPGNCDRILERLAGLRVFGIGGAGPGRFGFPYEWPESEIAALPVPPCDVLLSHTPPAGTDLDRLYSSGSHVGSEAIRDLARESSGVLVCGHIHEASGVERVGDCLCLNAGSLGAPYARPQVGFVSFDGARRRVVHHNLESGQVRELESGPD